MADPRLPGQRIFDVLNHNKQYDKLLTDTEDKLHKEQRRMLTRHLNDKAAIFDELIRLNVRTPNANHAVTPESLKFRMKEVEIDRKWMAQAQDKITKLRGTHKVVPLISIEGTEVVCYSNEVTKRGRHLTLPPRVNRKILEVTKLAKTLDELRKGEYDKSCANLRRPKSGGCVTDLNQKSRLPLNGFMSTPRYYTNRQDRRRVKTALSVRPSTTLAMITNTDSSYSHNYRIRPNSHTNSSDSSRSDSL